MNGNANVLMDNYFIFFDLVLGVYFIYCAITGKGAVFKSQLPEKYQTEMNKFIRIFMWVMGGLFLVSAANDFFGFFGEGNTLAAKILLGLDIVVFLVFMVIYKIKFDKYNKLAEAELEVIREQKRKERLESMGRRVK